MNRAEDRGLRRSRQFLSLIHIKKQSTGDRIIKATRAMDEKVPTIQPQPDLESTVVVLQPRWFLQHHSPLHGIRT